MGPHQLGGGTMDSSQVLPLNFTSFLTASFGGVVHSAYFHFQVAAGVPEQSSLVYNFHSKSSPAHELMARARK